MSVRATKLPSGLQIVTDSMRDLETASLGVFVGAGSRHEAVEEHGLSHLLEHMAFKGTRRRSARDIAEEIENVGGDLNAATSVDQTAYYARVLAEDADLALDILSDILIDSAFDEAELEREKNVILQEIGAVEDAPEDLVFDLFTAAAYPEQPIGRPILGVAKGVAGFRREAIEAYLRRHYAAPATVVAAAGAVDHDRIVEAAAARFARLGADSAPPPPPARYQGGEARRKRKLEQTHVAIGFEGVSFHDPNSYAAQAFANAVGGGMSSRLFQETREKRGLVYSIYSFHWSYSDSGLFGFYAASAPDSVREAVSVSLDCLGQAARELTEAEVARAKAQMKVSLLSALESSARAEQIARQLFVFGRVLGKEEIVARIEALSVETVRAAGLRLLRAAPTVAAIGAADRVADAAQIAERLDQAEAAMALFRVGSSLDSANFIRGESVYLRPLESRDYDQWSRLRECSRAFLAPWEPTWPPDDLTRSAFRRRLRRHAEEIARDESYPFLIFDESNDGLLGGLTLGQVRRGVAQAATLGYWMGAPYAGRGYMTKAARAAVAFGFAALRLHRVEAACLPHNIPSVRLLERVGFRREGYAHSYLRINGQWQDHALFALLESDATGR